MLLTLVIQFAACGEYAAKGAGAGATAGAVSGAVGGLFPEVVKTDWDIETEAEATMRKTSNSLMDIREQYNMPRVCPG